MNEAGFFIQAAVESEAELPQYTEKCKHFGTRQLSSLDIEGYQ